MATIAANRPAKTQPVVLGALATQYALADLKSRYTSARSQHPVQRLTLPIPPMTIPIAEGTRHLASHVTKEKLMSQGKLSAIALLSPQGWQGIEGKFEIAF